MTAPDDRARARARLYGSYVSANKGLAALGERQPESSGSRNFRYFAAELAPWLAPLPKEARILDVGCGPGFMLDVVKSLGFARTYGVDVSPEQARLAQARHPQVVQGDAFAFLAAQSEPFDAVLAFDLIEHFTVAEAFDFLDAVHRVLPVGGRLVIQTPNGDAPMVGPVYNGDLTHETLFTPHSLRHLLNATGFEVVEFREHGPRPVDLRSTVRWAMWRVVRLGYRVLHLAETGNTPSPVFTRVFRTLAQKR